MRLLPAVLALLLPCAAAAQTTPVRKLPPANPLPYEDPDAAAVMAPVNGLFAAIAARNGQAALEFVDPAGHLAAANEKEDGTRSLRHLSWAEFAAGIAPGPERFEERMPNPAIEVDGDIAMVWGDYVFLVDGKVSHCGVDLFDLVRENGRWRILNATWTRRSTGCPGR